MTADTYDDMDEAGRVAQCCRVSLGKIRGKLWGKLEGKLNETIKIKTESMRRNSTTNLLLDLCFMLRCEASKSKAISKA